MLRRFRPILSPKKPFVAISSESSRVFKTGRQRSEVPVFTGKVAPCRHACPIGINIPAAFERASMGDIDGALQVYLQDNPLPGVCGRVCRRPCESACNRGKYDEPINIRGFERFLADHGRAAAKAASRVGGGKKIAVVGSGPAGLSAAYHLAVRGYKITLFEARPEPGGLLRYGIPAFRLPPSALDMEIARILALGINSVMNTRVGADVDWQDLNAFDAVFMSVGLQRGRHLFESSRLPERILSGIEFLAEGENSVSDDGGAKILIIGGGNVAVDAARTLVRRRRGSGGNITVICPETREQMPALPDDLEAALAEGLQILNGWAPVEVLAGGSRPLAIDFCKARVDKDAAAGGTHITALDGGKCRHEADGVIVAVGQELDAACLPAEIHTARGRIAVDSFGRTSHPRIFAGGDAAGSGTFVAEAIAGGKMGALAIACMLEGADVEERFRAWRLGLSRTFAMRYFQQGAGEGAQDLQRVVAFEDINTLFFPRRARVASPQTDPVTCKAGFGEVVGGIDPSDLQQEIARCFKCGTCIDCGNCLDFCPDVSILRDAESGKYDVDCDYCKGCGMCSVACPRGIIEMEKDSR